MNSSQDGFIAIERQQTGRMNVNYLLLDLEWNSVKNPETGKFINEIIEIGAVKLNEQLQETGNFSQMVCPKITKELNPYVRNLTQIREEEVFSGVSFACAMERFSSFVQEPCVVMSWSNTDLYVLLDNYAAFLPGEKVTFLWQYMDLQKYVSQYIPTEPGRQISLSDAAERLGVDPDEFSLHRALDDSRLCACLLRKTYDPKTIGKWIQSASSCDFQKQMTFRSYYITDLSHKEVKPEYFEASCETCASPLHRISAIRSQNKSFSARYECPACGRKYRLYVKIRKTYRSVRVTKRLRPLEDSKTALTMVHTDAAEKQKIKNS